MQINAEILQKLANIVGDSYIFTDQETRNHYGHDETENYVFPPSVVVKPANAKEISEILKLIGNVLPAIAMVKINLSIYE